MTMSVNPSTLWFFNRVSFILGSTRVREKESMVERKWDEGRFKHYILKLMCLEMRATSDSAKVWGFSFLLMARWPSLMAYSACGFLFVCWLLPNSNFMLNLARADWLLSTAIFSDCKEGAPSHLIVAPSW